jgi:hypothetical protein
LSYHQFVIILQIIQEDQRQTTNDDAKVMKNDKNRIDEKLSCNSKTNKSLNEASVSANEHDTNSVCDQIVADYLKRNGFADVLSHFQESRQLQPLSDELEIPGKGSTLKRLIKFDRKNRKPPDEIQETNRKPPDKEEKNQKQPDKTQEENRKPPDKQEKSRKPPDKSQAKSQKEPDKQEKSRKPADKSQERSRKESDCHSDKSHEKRYDSWSNIREGFSDFEDHLNPDDPDSEVDKLVKHILDINIPIRYFNVKYGAYSNLKSLYHLEMSDIKKACPNFKIGRFTRGPKGEDGIIRQNWDKLVKGAQLKNPLKCIKDLMKLDYLKGATHLTLKKRNVLGCYLAQNMPNIRHGADVYQRAISTLIPWNEGKYSKEEDELILKQVEEHGATTNVFRKLAELLKRKRVDNVVYRYDMIKKGKEIRSGKWTLADLEQFFGIVFKEERIGNKTGIDYINSVPIPVIHDAAKLLDRIEHRVYLHWIGHIKPILLSYQSGTLHTEWKPQFFDYLIKNKIVSLQEINWGDAKEKFPNHCARSLTASLRTIQKTRTYDGMPLHLAVKDYKEKTKHSNERPHAKKFKEDIVFLYDKARGVSAT